MKPKVVANTKFVSMEVLSEYLGKNLLDIIEKFSKSGLEISCEVEHEYNLEYAEEHLLNYFNCSGPESERGKDILSAFDLEGLIQAHEENRMFDDSWERVIENEYEWMKRNLEA